MTRISLAVITILSLAACNQAPEPAVLAPAADQADRVNSAPLATPRQVPAPAVPGRRPLKKPLPAGIAIPVEFNRLIDNDMSGGQWLSRQVLLEHFETDIDRLDQTWQQALVEQGFVRTQTPSLGASGRGGHFRRAADGIEISLNLSQGASSQGGSQSGARGTVSLSISGPR